MISKTLPNPTPAPPNPTPQTRQLDATLSSFRSPLYPPRRALAWIPSSRIRTSKTPGQRCWRMPKRWWTRPRGGGLVRLKMLKMVEVEKCHMEIRLTLRKLCSFLFFMVFGGYNIIRPWTLGVSSCLNRQPFGKEIPFTDHRFSLEVHQATIFWGLWVSLLPFLILWVCHHPNGSLPCFQV